MILTQVYQATPYSLAPLCGHSTRVSRVGSAVSTSPGTPQPFRFWRVPPIAWTVDGYMWAEATLGEFILPYDAVRGATESDALLLDFLSTTYAAAAEAGGWDRAALECPIGVPGRVRRV